MPRQQRAKFGNKAKFRRSAHHKATGKYIRQRTRTAENKKRRLKKHLEKHPNDLQALKIFKSR